jgi:hypothetical protein
MRMPVSAAACIIGQQHRIQRYEIAVADHWSQARSPVRFFIEAIYLKFHRSIASTVTLSSARFMLNFDAAMLNFDTVRP